MKNVLIFCVWLFLFAGLYASPPIPPGKDEIVAANDAIHITSPIPCLLTEMAFSEGCVLASVPYPYVTPAAPMVDIPYSVDVAGKKYSASIYTGCQATPRLRKKVQAYNAPRNALMEAEMMLFLRQ